MEKTNALPCYVVSLTRAGERRQTISNALSELGIPFRFMDAVDAADGLEDKWLALTDHDPLYPLSPREYGCALSHRLVYESIIEEGHAHALVLEDDAIPLPALRRFIDLGCYRKRPLIQLFHQAAYVRWGSIELFDSVVARSLSMSCSGTVAYTLTRQAAVALLDAATPVRYKADWPMDIASLGACVTQPVLVQHPPDRAFSDIAVDRPKRKRSLKRYLNRQYYRTKWRRILSQRVRSQPLSTSE